MGQLAENGSFEVAPSDPCSSVTPHVRFVFIFVSILYLSLYLFCIFVCIYFVIILKFMLYLGIMDEKY